MMKGLFICILFFTQNFILAQTTWITKTSFSVNGPYRHPEDSLCGPKKFAITPDGTVALYVQINPDEFQLVLVDSLGNIFNIVDNGFNGPMTYRFLVGPVATPDSCFIYAAMVKDAAGVILQSHLIKVTRFGNPIWSHVFPPYIIGLELISSISLTPDSNYACQGYDSIYIVSPNGTTVPNPSNTSDFLLTTYTNSDQLIHHQLSLQRKDILGNIIWSIPFIGSYLCNDTMLYEITNDSIARFNPINGAFLWRSAAPGISTFDFSNDGGCVWLNTLGHLYKHNPSGQLVFTKSFPFALNGLTLIRHLPTGDYLIGGAYPSNTFMYLSYYMYSSFIASLDDAFNGVIDSTSVMWPMDANRDYFVSYTDIARLNLAYGYQGPPRQAWPPIFGAPSYLYSDFATDWDNSFCDGLNYKFSDANGDGVVDSLDFFTYHEFYQDPVRVYLRKSDSDINLLTTTFSLVPDRSTVLSGDTVRFYFILGDSLNPIDTLSAFAFDAWNFYGNFDPSYIKIEAYDNGIGLLSDLRLDTTTFHYGFATFGFMLARKDKQNSHNIYDTLGYVELKIFDTVSVSQPEMLTIKSISALSNCGIERGIVPVNGQIYIQARINSVEKLIPLELKLSPNPANQEFNLQLNRSGDKIIRISDLLGKTVKMIMASQANLIVKTADLQSGMYLLSVEDNSSRINVRLLVQH